MTDKPETVSLYQLFQRFPDEESARLYFEGNRWAGEVSCPHCGSLSVAEVKNHKPMPYRCRDCRQHFSVRTGTVLAESRLPLHKWLMAIYMMTTARKGIPSTQMARELARGALSAYLQYPNYRNSWARLGFTEADMAGGGSDRLVDALFAWGSAEDIAARVQAHLAAGADHVCLQVVTGAGLDVNAARPIWRELAGVLIAS